MRRLLGLISLALVLAACSTEGVPKGKLVLSVRGLPEGTPTIVIKGPTEVTANGPGTYELPVGTYALEARDVVLPSGKRYYAEQVKTPVQVKRNQETQAEVVYALDQNSLPGELALVVNGLPEGAEAAVSVENPDRGVKVAVKASTVLRLQAGTYLVKASRVSHGGMDYLPNPNQGSVVLEPGKRASYAVSYGPAKGELLVRIEGLPDGLSARVEVKDGQGSVVAALAESRVLSLAPGTYFVSAKDVVAQDGTTYRGSVSGSPAIVRAGGRAEAVATYAPVPRPSFAFSLSPKSLSLAQGQSTTLVASITPQSGFSGQIAFSLVSPPAGFSLSGGPVSPSEPVDVPLILSVASSVAPGTYSLVVKAEGGGVSRTQTLSVQVSPSTGQLALSILFQGAPAGTEGRVVLSGPNGDQVITRSQVLTLAPGTYTITAYSVSVNGVPYNPSPPGGTVEVVAGGRASFTVTYTPRSGGGAP